jgi:hypothetical protein
MREKAALDNWITGHYGEDQYRDEAPEVWLRDLARELATQPWAKGKGAAEIVDEWNNDEDLTPTAENEPWYDVDMGEHLAELLAYRLSHGVDMPMDGDGPDPDDDYEPDADLAADLAVERETRSDAQTLAEDVAFFKRYTEA